MRRAQLKPPQPSPWQQRLPSRNSASFMKMPDNPSCSTSLICFATPSPSPRRSAPAKKALRDTASENIERVTRRETGRTLSRERTIPKMIERIKDLFEDPAGESVSVRCQRPWSSRVTSNGDIEAFSPQ